MCKKIYNPKEAICLIAYCEKKTLIDISKKLYEGKRNTRIAGWVNELLEEEKIIYKHNPGHIRKPFYQTRPETLLNYIIKKLKEKDITINKSEKKEILNYLKSKEFMDHVKLMVDNLDVKSEHFTFSGLFDVISLQCIYEFNRHQFLEAKGISMDKIKSENLSLLKMSFDSQCKLGNLYHDAYIINKHYAHFITMINGVYQIEKQYKK